MKKTPQVKSVMKRGIKYFMLDLRPKKGRLFFRSKEEAMEELKEWLKEEREHCQVAMTALDRAYYFEAKQILGDVSILEAAKFYKLHKLGSDKGLTEAIGECVKAKRDSNKRSIYVAKLECRLDAFREFMGVVNVSQITTSDIERWIASNKKWNPKTRLSATIDLQTFFSYCVRQKWIAENPCHRLEKVILDDKPPGILTVEECKRWMNTCLEHDPEFVRSEALKLFAGLRPSEVLRLQPSDIGEDYVTVKGKVAKTRDRRLVSVNPTLREWLKIPGPLHPLNYWRRLYALRKKAAPLTWSHDCLRHSFISYSLPIQGAAKTALEAGHSETILFKHYRELVTREQAEEFWRILPKGV
jgi:integrase